MADQRFRTRLAAFTWIVAGLLTLFVLTLALAPRAEAFVYWNTAGSTIGRANPDGSGVDHEFITLGEFDSLSALAVDDGHVYWSLFGSCTEPGAPMGSGTMIGRAKLDGTAADRAFITGASCPAGLALDGEHIYWTNFGSGTIGRAKLDGTNVDQSFITGADGPVGIAVDGDHVYWTNYGGAMADASTIGRADLDGTDADQSFITGASLFTGLGVNDTHLYWVGSGTIGRAKLDGTGVNQEFIAAPDILGRGLALDAEHIYWSSYWFGADLVAIIRIARANLDGSGTELDFISLDESFGGPVWGVAVDALRSFSFGKAKRNRKRGTAKLTVLAPGPGDIALAKTKKVRAQRERAEVAGKVKLAIKPRGTAKKRLNRKGKAKVEAEVTYTPTGDDANIVANTDATTVKLIKR